jgi:signal transduction histidine kinase
VTASAALAVEPRGLTATRIEVARRLWAAVSITVGVSVAVTIAGGVSSRVPLVYRSAAAHIALDTVSGSIALLAAVVLAGRFRFSGLMPDLLAAMSLGVLGTTNVAFAITSAGAADEGSPIRLWTPLVWRFIGALLLAVASLIPDHVVRGKRRMAVVVGTTVLLVLLAAAVLTNAFGGGLPMPNVPPAHRLTAFQPTAIAIVQLTSAVVIIASAVAFGRRGIRERDEFFQWLSASCVLFAFARFNYAIFPSLYSSWIYTGDVLRFGFYFLVLTGAVREIVRLQRRATEQEAVIEERRRLARDLHDELAQDLAYIALEARLALASAASPRLEQLAVAAERALERSRSAIIALAPTVGTLGELLTAAVEEAASRGETRLYLDVPPTADAPPPVRDALVQIAREAVRNASRHADADHIWVVLSTGESLRLAIVDDGKGFPLGPSPRPRTGFGLTSMRERAERIDASFRIDSTSIGTTVEVIA